MPIRAMWRVLDDQPTEATMTITGLVDIRALVSELAQPSSDTAMLEHSERPLFNEDLGLPDHTVFMAVNGDFGYLSYQDTEQVRAFPAGEAGSPGLVSEFEDFPEGSGLPIETVIAMVNDFLVTGHRPESVEWRDPVR